MDYHYSKSLTVSRCNLNQSIGIYGAEQPPDFAAASSNVGVLNEATVDLVLLAAIEQFEYQQAALEEYI